MEPAGVPALIAYRGGDKFAGLVPIMDEIPDDADFNALTLEAVLRRYVSNSHGFKLSKEVAEADSDYRHQVLQ